MGNATLALLALLALLGTAVFLKGGWRLLGNGALVSFDLLSQVAPQLLIGFLLAGFVSVLLPANVLTRYLGTDSGWLGLVIATLAGMATPGGPFLQFPLIASLASAGAAPGPLAAYVTAWSVLSLNRLIAYELPLLGAPFTAARWLVSLALPVLVGLAVPAVLRMAAAINTRE